MAQVRATRRRRACAATSSAGASASGVSIPGGNIIWSVAGLVIFGGYTVLDFNRLRRSGQESAVPIAASIFLDVLNIFLFFLHLFGGDNE